MRTLLLNAIYIEVKKGDPASKAREGAREGARELLLSLRVRVLELVLYVPHHDSGIGQALLSRAMMPRLISKVIDEIVRQVE
jgi:hypothetical protein